LDALLRRAKGMVANWPSACGRLSVLPPDPVLAWTGWREVRFDLGPDLGSDHRSVVVQLTESL